MLTSFKTEHIWDYHWSGDGNRLGLVRGHTDSDVVLIRDGYHPVVAGPGYDVYYLNFIAGKLRSLANSEDPRHKWIRSQWKEVDARLPLVRAMEVSR